jgi:hypothetical protein
MDCVENEGIERRRKQENFMETDFVLSMRISDQEAWSSAGTKLGQIHELAEILPALAV